jgi:hypothetical protein
MELKTIIIILTIILLVLFTLNYINYIKLHYGSQTNSQSSSEGTSSSQQGSCSQTVYGCCPDGVNSKINFYGTNCPGYMPPPGYPTNSN